MTTLAAQIAQGDKFFTRYKEQTSRVEFLKGGPGVHQTGLNLAYGGNRQDPVLSEGFGKVLQERRLQERQAAALEDNRTGSYLIHRINSSINTCACQIYKLYNNNRNLPFPISGLTTPGSFTPWVWVC